MQLAIWGCQLWSLLAAQLADLVKKSLMASSPAPTSWSQLKKKTGIDSKVGILGAELKFVIL